MNTPTLIPGGWPLHKTQSHQSVAPAPLNTVQGAEQVSEAVSPLSTVHPSQKTRPMSTVSAITEPQDSLLKVPTARTTQTRPPSGATDNVYFDAPDSTDGQNEKKFPLKTISSKDGSSTPASKELSRMPSSNDESATTINANQAPQQKLTTSAILMSALFSRYWADWWLWEFISFFLALVSSASIIMVLAVYDNKPLNSWRSPMTPNAFIAMFITLAQAGLVVPISSSISQLKWIWFRMGERPLVDFETFDEASRGPVGGLKLMGTLKGGGIVRHLANFGIITGILSLAVSPFTQMLISFPTNLVPDNRIIASAPRSEKFDGYVSRPGAAGVPKVSMMRAIQYSLSEGTTESRLAVFPACPSGNCNWSPYSSLAICSQVANVTDRLTITGVPVNTTADSNATITVNNFEATLPNGASLEADQFAVNITTGPAGRSLAFGALPNINDIVISNSFIIYQKDINTQEATFGAVEILLHWCVNTYNSSVKDNESITQITTNSTMVHSTSGPNSALVMKAAEGATDYTVDGQANFALQTYLSSIFSGSYSVGFGYFSTDTAMAISSALYEQTDLAGATGQNLENMQFGGILNATNNVAISMTNIIRQDQSGGAPAAGTALVRQPYIHVSWFWICYLNSLLFSSLSLLIFTMYLSRKAQVDVMRSSAIAAASALSAESKNFMGPIDLKNKSWMKAYLLKVWLNKGGEGWALEARM